MRNPNSETSSTVAIRKMNLKDHFPRASQAFLDANPLSSPSELIKTSSTGNVDVRNVRRGRLNKTESEFAMILEAMKRKGEILRYEFEGMTLRWFDMRYTPDFVVFNFRKSESVVADLPKIALTFIEVKGAHIHYAQQAMARFKGARGFWPEFTFELWQRQKGGEWKHLI